MLYVTGDTHGEPRRFCDDEMKLDKNDYLIICGDFGYIFFNDENENKFLDELEKKPYNICFCDGNHENFPVIYAYPEKMWNGGRVHEIRKNIFHLMRGQIYEIEGKSIFTMGGAYSIDRYMRREGLSFWSEEVPKNSDYRQADISLKEHNYKVDYIITHTAPGEVISAMGAHPDVHDSELTGYFDYLIKTIDFKKWYFGHWHTDMKITDSFRAIWLDKEVL